MKARLTVFCGLFVGVHLSALATVPPSYAKHSAEWLQSDEGRRIAQNVVTWQSPYGSWPKNSDTASKAFEGDPKKLQGTFDNGATTSELQFLAKAVLATGEASVKAAFLKGLDHILEVQYPTGGWPQRYPPGNGYHRYITYNDHTMVRLLEMLREVADSPDYPFVDAPRRAAAKTAFDKGIQCILASQIVVDGTPTVWCAQHDQLDLRPRPARVYELESLSGSESAAILKLLMKLPDPSPEVRRSIVAGAGWFDAVKINGIRIQRTGNDRIVVADPEAPPVWARFYEIGTNRPLFCGRDGIKKYRLSEIDRERRTGYAWYGNWGKEVATAYAKWQSR